VRRAIIFRTSRYGRHDIQGLVGSGCRSEEVALGTPIRTRVAAGSHGVPRLPTLAYYRRQGASLRTGLYGTLTPQRASGAALLQYCCGDPWRRPLACPQRPLSLGKRSLAPGPARVHAHQKRLTQCAWSTRLCYVAGLPGKYVSQARKVCLSSSEVRFSAGERVLETSQARGLIIARASAPRVQRWHCGPPPASSRTSAWPSVLSRRSRGTRPNCNRERGQGRQWKSILPSTLHAPALR